MFASKAMVNIVKEGKTKVVWLLVSWKGKESFSITLCILKIQNGPQFGFCMEWEHPEVFASCQYVCKNKEINCIL
jgi:hypothetical protein